MSLFSVLDISGSGMNAQSVRLNTVSSNLANADAVSSSIDETYRARMPVFRAVMDEMTGKAESSQVEVAGIIESQAPLEQEYAPEHPLSDENGYIYHPNVNVVEEMANMMSASRAFQNNVETFNASKQMLLATLRLGQ